MRCTDGKLGWLLSILVATLVIGAMNSNAVQADIVFNGDVVPSDSASWSSDTDGYIGKTDGHSGTIMITPGGECNLPSNSSYIGHGLDSHGTVTVNGSGATWSNEGILNVGYYGRGELHVIGGGSVTNTNALLGFDGNYDGGVGIVEVDGPGSIWTNRGDLFIAYGPISNGAVNITNGAEVRVDGITQVAIEANATGAITFGSSGGTLTTKTLRASASQMTGVGTINAKGLVSDHNLTFDGLNATHGLTHGTYLRISE